jgi:hypothetical protein
MTHKHTGENTMLKFSKANAKTQALKNDSELADYLTDNRKIYSLDLLSGYSCPYAEKCLSKAVVQPDGKRKIKDGKKTEFRCFSASQEVQYTNFFNQEYMQAWYAVALRNPRTLFYAYTKSLRFWVGGISEFPEIWNFVLTASYGGRDDHMIDEFNLRSAKVVFSEAEAEELGLAIDHDDSHAAKPTLRDDSFALLIHGTQPAGSEASTALKKLKGKGSYSRKKVQVSA